MTKIFCDIADIKLIKKFAKNNDYVANITNLTYDFVSILIFPKNGKIFCLKVDIWNQMQWRGLIWFNEDNIFFDKNNIKKWPLINNSSSLEIRIIKEI